MNKVISKLFTNIRNGQGTHKIFVINKNSRKVCNDVLKILVCKGFICGFCLENLLNVSVFLKYRLEVPVILKNISFSSKHFFISYLALCKIQHECCIILLSTSRGVLTHKEAIFYKVGGFVICKIV